MVRVSVRAAFVPANEPVPARVQTPEAPAASKVAPPVPKVKSRSVDEVTPTYLKVPPFRKRLAAALDAEPRFPDVTPPLPSEETLKVVPALIVATPVKVFAPVSVKVPPPEKVSDPAPLKRLATETAPERLKARAALFTMAPEPAVPVTPPAPTCSVPAVIVRVPEKELAPSRIKVPDVVLEMAAPLLISATFLRVPAARVTTLRLFATAEPPILNPPRSRVPPLRLSVPVVRVDVPMMISPATVSVPPVRLTAAVTRPLPAVLLPS